MQSRSRGVGFTEDVGKFMVVHWDTSHVNWSVIMGSLVRKKELVDLSIVHLGEISAHSGKGNISDQMEERFLPQVLF